ncbi:2Fe-2S iron-sulfur cluster-binding protein [Streptomyces sp. NPDC002431]
MTTEDRNDEHGRQDDHLRHGSWQPTPQGGEYDDGATAFVQLSPEDLANIPLAAPGHGYVPPMIVPLTPAAGLDPTATGTWAQPDHQPETGTAEQPSQGGAVHWPDPNQQQGPYDYGYEYPQAVAPHTTQHPQQAAHAPQAPHDPRTPHAPQPPHDPFAQLPPEQYGEGQGQQATGQWNFTESAEYGLPAGQAPHTAPAGEHPGHGGHTGQWTIPVAEGELPEESGEFAASALAAQWYGNESPSATLPGGAPAPWATQPEPAVRQEPVARPEPVAQPQPTVQPEPAAVVEPEPAPVAAPVAAPVPVVEPEPEPEPESEPVQESGPAPVAEAVAQAAPVAEPVADPVPEAASGPAPEPVPEPAAEPVAGPVPAVDEAPAERTPEEVPEPEAEAEPATRPEDAPSPADTRTPADTEAPEAEAADSPEDADPQVQPGLPDEHPAVSYVLHVNGADRPVSDAWIGESLLYVLRERLGLAGAKDGCSQGECGACNVQVDGRLVASCLVPAATTAGSEVRTVEGLAVDGEPSDVQRALAKCGAVQCGFCIPGMAMTVHDLLEGNHAPSELETRQALCGNLCRCSGYRGVLDAVNEVIAGREALHAAASSDSTSPEPDEAGIPHQAAPGAGSETHAQDGGMA